MILPCLVAGLTDLYKLRSADKVSSENRDERSCQRWLYPLLYIYIYIYDWFSNHGLRVAVKHKYSFLSWLRPFVKNESSGVRLSKWCLGWLEHGVPLFVHFLLLLEKSFWFSWSDSNDGVEDCVWRFPTGKEIVYRSVEKFWTYTSKIKMQISLLSRLQKCGPIRMLHIPPNYWKIYGKWRL